MKAIVTVVGHDAVGLLSKVSSECAKFNANILDVTQSVLEGIFNMVMVIDISTISSDFATLAESFETLGDDIGMKIHVMHEDIFNSMHRI